MQLQESFGDFLAVLNCKLFFILFQDQMELTKAKSSKVVPYEFKVPSRAIPKPKKVLSEDDFSEVKF